uniref:C-type lectin domain-containing protein n=1 Tax=Kryptolebias marmoratus TaxID=37003 RepID=A0A3Q3ALP0_KRYMA
MSSLLIYIQFSSLTLRKENVFLFLGLCSCLCQYILVNEQKNWNDAKKYCQEKYTDLATMDSMEDIDELFAAAGSFRGTVWIGLYDLDELSSWKWSAPNGFKQGSYFAKWNSKQSIYSRDLWELCGAQLDDTWFEFHCNVSQPFVCYNTDQNVWKKILF